MTKDEVTKLQAQFLRGVEDVIPSNSSLVSELSDVLEISTDSAYRRMRGETLLTIDEIIILCDHFQISFDAFSKVKPGMVTFTYAPLESNAESLALYLENLRANLFNISASKDKSIVLACQDIPVFHHFNYPDLANFKIFYWMRTIMNLPDLNRIKYEAELQFPELLDIGRSIYETYCGIPSVEVWTHSTIQSMLNQISFYWDSGIFESKEDALRVCSALSAEIDDFQQMAEVGSKQPNDCNLDADERTELESEDVGQKNYKMYVSDIELTNNCMLVNLPTSHIVHLGHLSFSTMATNNDSYCKKTEVWISNIIKKSTLISGVSEKQRFQFFLNMSRDVDALMKRIDMEGA